MLNLFNFKTAPYEHQKTALEKSWNKLNYAFFMEMGTGKTKVTIDNIGLLRLHEGITGVLIIAPKSVYTVWAYDEIEKHMSPDIDYTTYIWNLDKPKKLQQAYKVNKDLTIFCMNVEALSTARGLKGAMEFLKQHKAMTIIDESTTIKNHKAIRTRNVLKLSKHSFYRRILTGSPVTKSPLDLYKQCEFLNENLLDFSSYYAFRTRYAKMTTMRLPTHSVQVVTGYQNLGELSEKIGKFSDRVLKEDCLDLPEYTYQKRIIQLSPEQQKLYDQMKKVALAQMDGKLMTTSTALVQLMRLQQITCGHFKADDGTLKIIKNERVNALMDILGEVEGKAIIWAHWRHDIDSIVKAIEKVYPGSVMTYYGSTSTDDRQKAIKEIQDPDSKIRFLVGTPQTGGYGITLTEANVMIYYSNGYDLEKRTQSEARINRIGQTRKMTYIDIIAEKTVDERIVKALRKKINIASEVMGEELKEWI